jgi:hypothetical protein
MEAPKVLEDPWAESKEGVRQLAKDIKGFAQRKPGTRFGFADWIRIVEVCLLAGIAFGVGLEIVRIGLTGGF